MEFLYIAWFQNSIFPPDDQDFEWPACFVIEAASKIDATEWGDHLSRQYVVDDPDQTFLRSDSEVILEWSNKLNELPRIKHGQQASKDEIGW